MVFDFSCRKGFKFIKIRLTSRNAAVILPKSLGVETIINLERKRKKKMHWIDWCIMIIPLIIILGAAIYSGKYVRGVVDFLAAGRVAGRYVISVGDLT